MNASAVAAQIDKTSLRKLIDVNRFRHRKAQSAVLEQKNEVMKSEVELAGRRQKVAGMKSKVQANTVYMEQVEITSNPTALIAAGKFRNWLVYDLEREEYYVELTEEELKEKQVEHARLLALLNKLQSKLDAVKDLEHAAELADDRLEEELIEEENALLMTALDKSRG